MDRRQRLIEIFEDTQRFYAQNENGVLSLTIPKKEQQKVNEKKQILIEG